MMYYLFLEFRKQYNENGSSIFKKKKNIVIYFLILLTYFAPDIYSGLTGSQAKYTDFKKYGTVKAGIIQPNVNPWVKWKENTRVLTEDIARMIKESSAKSPGLDMIILPEAAVTYYIADDMNESKYDILKDVVDSLDIPVLIGAPDLILYTDTLNAPMMLSGTTANINTVLLILLFCLKKIKTVPHSAIS